ncbi:MAG: enoyl-CoA hydratase-related protein [Pseudomonadota bacterium]|nr:enoyl-CoA hydratase-related protein [Pseudomonadota bacterium]
MSEYVRVERDGELLAITLARPERRNAITVEMYSALGDAIAAGADPEVRLITIRGEGSDFTAGNDLADFMTALPRASDEEIPVWRLLRLLVENQTPLVAAVQGNCVGIGTTMLLHCDLVVVADNACFKMPFVELGLVPEAASSLLLPDLAGRRRAARYLLLGESFGAEEALAIGLASHRAVPAELDQRLGEIVTALLAQPREALRATQRLLRDGPRDELLTRIALENASFGERLESAEVKEAITKFFAARSARSPG